jgi:hypothetical protein
MADVGSGGGGGGVVVSIISHITLAHTHSSTHTSNNHLSLLRHHAYGFTFTQPASPGSPSRREEDPVPLQQVCSMLEVAASPSHAPTPRRAERVLRVAGAGQELPVQLPLHGGCVGHPLAHEDVDRLEAALVPCHLAGSS